MNVFVNSAKDACHGPESLLKNDVTFKSVKTSGSGVYTLAESL